MKARTTEISINWSCDLFLIPFIDQSIDLFVYLLFSFLQNTSSDMNHTTDGFINSIFNDEDLHLMDMTDSKCWAISITFIIHFYYLFVL